MATIWPSITLSLLIIYIFIQSRLMNTDHLTGHYNRREFDYHLDEWQNWHSKKKKLAGFMMDLDHFKSINDTYGHHAGDKALVYFSEILRSSFRHNDFIARIGGDEFTVILEVSDLAELAELRLRLLNNVEKFNQQTNEPFKLSFSCGTGQFDPQNQQSLQDFFGELDKRMYEEKEQHRRQKGFSGP